MLVDTSHVVKYILVAYLIPNTITVSEFSFLRVENGVDQDLISATDHYVEETTRTHIYRIHIPSVLSPLKVFSDLRL